MINRDRLLQKFLEYSACASESYRERDFCLLLERELDELGLTWERQEIGAQVGSDGWNLRALLPGEGEPLLFCAHMDTVSPGAGVRPVVQDGVIRTDGTTVLGGDDKAGIAASLEALRAVAEEGGPHRPAELLFTICEEVGMLGSKHADYSRLLSREAVVLDGEEVGSIVFQAAAHLELHFVILGRSAHAGISPEKGIHALKAAAECVAGIRCGHVSETGVVNVANLLCPGATNIVPERAEFDVELRSYEETELQELLRQICAHVERVCASWGARFEKSETRISRAFRLSPDAPVIRAACAAMEAQGICPALERTLGGSDLTWLSEHGIAAVNLGVGMQEVHSCKEFLRVDDLVSTAGILARMLRG